MANNYILLIRQANGRYSLSWKHSWEDASEQDRREESLGSKVERIYEIDEGLSGGVLRACSDFGEGVITFGELEKRIKEIRETKFKS